MTKPSTDVRRKKKSPRPARRRKSRASLADLRALVAELALADERERRRLAVDLHDGLGQILTLANLKLALCRQGDAKANATETLTALEDLIQKAAKAGRTVALRLSHPGLYDLGFVEAVQWLAEDIAEQEGLSVTMYDDGLPKPIAEAARVMLFRCVRDVLAGLARQGGVRQATVRVTRAGRAVRVRVEDFKDRAGRQLWLDLAWVLDPGLGPSGRRGGAAARSKRRVGERRKRRLGTLSIQERLSHVGGRVKIASTPAGAASVTLEVRLGE